MKHTAAPWELYETHPNGFRFGDIEGNDKLLFQNMLITKHNAEDEAIANSYLVSAAPELLAALKCAKTELEYLGYKESGVLLKEINAAISKAENK